MMPRTTLDSYYTHGEDHNGTYMLLATVYGWQHPVACRAICPDGKTRTVRLSQAADTFFSWPGRVTIGKRTVRGFVSIEDERYIFTPYQF